MGIHIPRQAGAWLGFEDKRLKASPRAVDCRRNESAAATVGGIQNIRRDGGLAVVFLCPRAGAIHSQRDRKLQAFAQLPLIAEGNLGARFAKVRRRNHKAFFGVIGTA